MQREKVAIGIDFGTYKTTVAHWNKTHAEIISTKDGSRYIPSCIYYTEKERLIGEAAINYPPRLPENRLFGLRRIIGCKASDPIITKMKHKGYDNIVDASHERVQIALEYFGKRKFFPEHITGVFLKKVKENAEEQLKVPINSAVFSIPYAFTKFQSDALISAASIAGIEVLKIVNESALAALDYSLRINTEKVIMIFNFGAGFLDLGIFKVNSGKCQTLVLGGSEEIGGEDINSIIIEHCLRKCEDQFGYSIRKNPKVLAKLMIGCEKAKQILSANKETTIEIENIVPDNDFTYTLTRDLLESMCSPILKQCIDCVHELFRREELDKLLVDDVVLVGGSTRMPKLKQMLEEYFGKPPLSSINADEAVANGAAIEAIILSGVKPLFSSSSQIDLALTEVFPHSILFNDSLLVQRNSCIPMSFTRTLSLKPNVKAFIYEVVDETKTCIGYIKTDTTSKIFSVEVEIDNKNTLKIINGDLKILWSLSLTYDELKYAKYEEQELDKKECEHNKTKLLRNEYEVYINGHKGRIEELKKSGSIDKVTERLSGILIKQELDWVENLDKIAEGLYIKKKDHVEYLFGLIFKKKYEELALFKGLSKELGDELRRITKEQKDMKEKIDNLKKLSENLTNEFTGSTTKFKKGIKLIEKLSKEVTFEEIQEQVDQLKTQLKEDIRNLCQLINKN